MTDKNNEPNKRRIFERLLDYVSGSPFITLWSVAMTVGGLIGYVHYAELGYVPEVDLGSAPTIFIALALPGISLTVAIAVIFLVPAFYLRLFFSDMSAPPRPADPSHAAEVAERRRVARLSIGGALFSIGMWCVVLWIFTDNPLEFPNAGMGLSGAFLIFISIRGAKLITALLARLEKLIKKRVPDASRSWMVRNGDFLASILVWFFALLIIVLMLEVPIFNNRNLSDGDKVFWLACFLGVVVIANTVLAVPGIPKAKFAPLILTGFAVAPAVSFLNLPDNSYSIEKAAFNRLGLGSIRGSFFIVSPQVCNAINIMRENACVPMATPTVSADERTPERYGCVRPVYLENRIGPEFLLAYGEDPKSQTKNVSHEAGKLLIPLKKDDVLLWGFGATSKSGTSICPETSK